MIYDSQQAQEAQEQVAQAAEQEANAVQPAAQATAPPRPRSHEDTVALSAINNAMEKISAASQTWIDIADAASGLLMYERAEVLPPPLAWAV